MRWWHGCIALLALVALSRLVTRGSGPSRTPGRGVGTVDAPASQPPQAAAGNRGGSSTLFSRMASAWLAEKLVVPAVLVVLTAFVGSYLIPGITRQWQDHQKEIELKNGLVSQMSDAATRMAFAVQLEEFTYHPGQDLSAYDAAYRDWSVTSQVLAAKLDSYFDTPLIGQNWALYTRIVTNLYLTSDCSGVLRRQRLADMRRDMAALMRLDGGFMTTAEIGPSVSGAAWKTLERGCTIPLQKNSTLALDWQQLHDAVVSLQSLPVQAVLRGHIAAY